MSVIARKDVRSSPLFRRYRRSLAKADINGTTQQSYASSVSSWMFTLSELMGAESNPRQERFALANALAGDRMQLKAARPLSVSAVALSLSYEETCDALLAYLKGRTVSVQATRIVALQRFYDWLVEQGLIPFNHFAHIRKFIELRKGALLPSLEKARSSQSWRR
jgi:hypothetical protein